MLLRELKLLMPLTTTVLALFFELVVFRLYLSKYFFILIGAFLSLVLNELSTLRGGGGRCAGLMTPT